MNKKVGDYMLQLTKLDGRTLLVDPHYIENAIPVITPDENYTLLIITHGEQRDLYRVKETPDNTERMIQK